MSSDEFIVNVTSPGPAFIAKFVKMRKLIGDPAGMTQLVDTDSWTDNRVAVVVPCMAHDPVCVEDRSTRLNGVDCSVKMPRPAVMVMLELSVSSPKNDGVALNVMYEGDSRLMGWLGSAVTASSCGDTTE